MGKTSKITEYNLWPNPIIPSKPHILAPFPVISSTLPGIVAPTFPGQPVPIFSFSENIFPNNLDLPWYNLRPFLLALLLIAWEKRLTPICCGILSFFSLVPYLLSHAIFSIFNCFSRFSKPSKILAWTISLILSGYPMNIFSIILLSNKTFF